MDKRQQLEEKSREFHNQAKYTLSYYENVMATEEASAARRLFAACCHLITRAGIFIVVQLEKRANLEG